MKSRERRHREKVPGPCLVPAKSDSPPSVPSPKRPGPELPPDWQEAFLAEIRRTGGFFKAAEAAGVHPKTATRWMNANPEFQEAVRDARERHADQLEEELEDMGRSSRNPVPHIVRLKALRPAEYIEKHAVMNVTASVTLSEDDGKALLAAMLSDVTLATRRALAQPELEGRKVLETGRAAGAAPPEGCGAEDVPT